MEEKSKKRFAVACTVVAAVVCASTFGGFNFLKKKMRRSKTVRFADEHGNSLIEVSMRTWVIADILSD